MYKVARLKQASSVFDGFRVDRELPAGQDRRAWITLLAIVASLTVSCSTLRNIPVFLGRNNTKIR